MNFLSKMELLPRRRSERFYLETLKGSLAGIIVCRFFVVSGSSPNLTLKSSVLFLRRTVSGTVLPGSVWDA